MRVLIITLVLLLSGCHRDVPLDQQQVTIEDDQFSKLATFSGSQLLDAPFGGITKLWYLRSFVNERTGATTHQLYVEIGYSGDKISEQLAIDDSSTKLELIRIEHSVGRCPKYGCTRSEIFAAMIPDRTLRKRATTGAAYAIKFYDKDGDWMLLRIDPLQMKMQLASIDQFKAAHGLK